ncbi:MAG: bifunctional hydroxymethylpyrimidine kinase/phosphomethylpyrimidine kinase [Terriglobales bacterium]|jgi:hydroxymethylpyrimidine/phosphomethylpyrimidine kinase
MPSTPPIVLTIAGFDPSSGAGITADIKVIAAQECYGVACISALTVQSTQGVGRVQAAPHEIITATLEMLVADLSIAAVHIGMMANEHVVGAVADFLERTRLPHVVLDPILRSTSGAELLNSAGTRVMVERLFPLAELVTPNLDEAAALTGMEVASAAAASGSSQVASLGSSVESMREAARRLHSLGAANVVVTGGHLEKAIDLLSFGTAHGIEQEIFKAERQRSTSTHGTGCAFATALACHLAHGRGLPEAVLLSKAYISAAIANAYPLGRGKGPLHHLYRMHQQRRPSQVVMETEHAHSRN